jgi:hypothetical protein
VPPVRHQMEARGWGRWQAIQGGEATGASPTGTGGGPVPTASWKGANHCAPPAIRSFLAADG